MVTEKTTYGTNKGEQMKRVFAAFYILLVGLSANIS